MGERPAQPGERCTCGRQAIVVIRREGGGEVGWCGMTDGGDRAGPCPFCGGERHVRGSYQVPCPEYRLRAVNRNGGSTVV